MLTGESPSNASLNRRVLLGTGLQGFGRLISSGCAFLALVLIGQSLGDEAFGIYNYYFPLYIIAGTTVDFGSYSVAVREIARHPDQEGVILRFLGRFRLGTASGFALLISGVAWFQEPPGTQRWLLILAAWHLVLLVPASLGAHLHARMHFLPLALAQVAGSVAFLLLATWLWSDAHRQPAAYLLAFGTGVAVRALIIHLAALRTAAPRQSPSREFARGLFREMLPLGISAAAGSLYFWLDAFLLREIAGEKAVGDYHRAFRLVAFGIMLPVYFCQALEPAFAKCALRDPDRFVILVRRAVFYLMTVALPLAAWIPWVSGAMLTLIWGKEPGDTEKCLGTLALASVCIFATYPQVVALTALGKQRDFTRIVLFAGPLKLGVILVLYRPCGILGAALATLAIESFVLFMVSRRLRSYLKRAVFSSDLLRPFGVAAVVGALASQLQRIPGDAYWPCAFALLVVGFVLAGILPFDLKAEN